LGVSKDLCPKPASDDSLPLTWDGAGGVTGGRGVRRRA
jgi:hypothetical protein